MRCQHNTRNPSHTKKNTHCPAGLNLVLKRNRESLTRESRLAVFASQNRIISRLTRHTDRLSFHSPAFFPYFVDPEMLIGRRGYCCMWALDTTTTTPLTLLRPYNTETWPERPWRSWRHFSTVGTRPPRPCTPSNMTFRRNWVMHTSTP